MSDKDDADFYVMYCCPGCHVQFHTKNDLISHINTCVKKPPKCKDVATGDAIKKEETIKTDAIKQEVVEGKGTSVFPATLMKIDDARPNKMKMPVLLAVPDSPSQEKSINEDSFKMQNTKSELVKSEVPSVLPVSLRLASEHTEVQAFSSQPDFQDSRDTGNSQNNDDNHDTQLHFKISSVTSLTDPKDIEGFDMECEEIQVDRYSDVEESDEEDYFQQTSQQLLLTPQLAKSTNIIIKPQQIEQPKKTPQISNVIDEANKDKPDFLHRIILPIKVDPKGHQRTIVSQNPDQIMHMLPAKQSVTPSKPYTVNSAGSRRKSRMTSSSQTPLYKILPRKTPQGTLLLIPQGKKSQSEEDKTHSDPKQQTNGNPTSDTSQLNSKRKGTANNLLLIPIKTDSPAPVPTTSSSSSSVNKQSILSYLGQPASTVTAALSSDHSVMNLMNTSVLSPRLGTNIPIPSIAALPMPVIPSTVNHPVTGMTPVQNVINGQAQIRFPLSPSIQPPKTVLNNPVTCSNNPVQFFVNAGGQICIPPIQNSLNPILIQNPTNPFPATNSTSFMNSPAPVPVQNFQAAPVMTTNSVITVTVDSTGKVSLVPAMNVTPQGQIPQSVPNLSTNQNMLLTGTRVGSPMLQQIPGQNLTHTVLPPNVTTPIPFISAPNIASPLHSAKSISVQNFINKALAQNSTNSSAASNQIISSSSTNAYVNQNLKTPSAVQSLTGSAEVDSAISSSEQSSSTGLKSHQNTSERSVPANKPKAVPTGLSIPLILWPGNTASSNKADLPAIINPNADLGKLFEFHSEMAVRNKIKLVKKKPPKVTAKSVSAFKVKINPLALHGYSRSEVSLEQKDAQTAARVYRKANKSVDDFPRPITVESSCQTDFTEYPELIVITEEKKKKVNLKKSTEDEKPSYEFTLMINDYTDDQPEDETIRRSSRIRSKPQKSYVEESDEFESEDEIDYGEFVIDRYKQWDKQWSNRFRIVGTQTLYEKLVADIRKDLIEPEEDIDSTDEDEFMDEDDPDYDPDGFENVVAVVEEKDEDEEYESDKDPIDSEDFSEAEYIKRIERLKKINSARVHPRGLDLEKHSEKYTVEVSIAGGVKREIFKCTFCDAGFKVLTEDALRRHLFKHVDRRYFCPFCSHNDLSGNFTEHITEEHSDRLTHICESCPTAFIDNRKLAIHRSKEHQDYMMKCEYCDAGFTYHSSLIRHKREAHNGQGLHICPECDRNFLEEKMFILHCKYAKCEKKQTQALCQECGAVVANKLQLAAHIKRVHMKERHYMCDLCSFTCYQMAQLKDHKTIHTREYQYKCPHCDFKAAKRVQVNSHVRIHTGDKPYKCDKCNYRSAWNIQLRTHRGAHCSRFMVMCDPCGIAFKDDRGLHLHQKKTHSGKDEEKGNNSDSEEEIELSAESDDSGTDEHTKVKSKRKRSSAGKANSSAKKRRKSDNQK